MTNTMWERNYREIERNLSISGYGARSNRDEGGDISEVLAVEWGEMGRSSQMSL